MRYSRIRLSDILHLKRVQLSNMALSVAYTIPSNRINISLEICDKTLLDFSLYADTLIDFASSLPCRTSPVLFFDDHSRSESSYSNHELKHSGV